MPIILTSDDRKDLTKRLHSQLGIWNQNEGNSVKNKKPTDNEVRVAADILHCLAELGKFTDMKTFVSGLGMEILSTLKCVRKSFISIVKLKIHQQKFSSVFEMIMVSLNIDSLFIFYYNHIIPICSYLHVLLQ